MFSTLVIFAAFCGLMLPTSEAFSYGTASCAAGRPAIGVEHLVGDPSTEITRLINGTLGEGKIFLYLNGVPLRPDVAASFNVGKDHNLTLASVAGYKGLLIRMGGVGTDAFTTLPDEEMLSPSIFCTGSASGVTHTNAEYKFQSTVILNHKTPASNLPVDVTVVVRNSEGVSEFYYSRFILNATSSATPVTPVASSVPPTTQPVVPTQNPTSKPSTRVAPNTQPLVPTRNPTSKPSTRRPTKKPTRRPTKKPSRRPTVKPNR